MPAVLISVLRPLIIWVVQIAVTTVIADALASILKSIVGATAQYYNIAEDDAKIVVLNTVIDVAALVGVGTGTLYSKLGVKAADVIGLKAVGNVKKAVTASLATKLGVVEAKAGASITAKGVLASFFKGNAFWKILGPLMLFQQIGDWFVFGRPQLQGYFDAIFGKDELKLPTASDTPPGFSKAEWENYYTGLELAGIVGIEGGNLKASMLYSRDALTQLVWWGYGEQLKSGKSATSTAIIKYIQPFLRFKDGKAQTTSTSAPRSPTVGGGQASAAATPQIQVYTGVVTSGTLGTPSEFVSRPDDMIQNIRELKDAAKINLAAFVQTLPGRFYYEVAIVNSIKTQAGFTQKGSAVRIVSSYNKDGTPRYKTIYNKFAVMKVGVTTPNGKDILLNTITLGPVNVVEFQPTQGDLEHIAGTLSSELFTSNVEDIKQINSPSAVVVNNQPVSPPPPPETPPVATQPVPTFNTKYKVSTGGANLNLRAEADAYAEVLAKIPDGTILSLDPNTGDHVQGGFTWHITSYNGQSGYVAREYLTADLGISALNNAPDLQPASTAGIASLTPNQRETYDMLISIGASGDAAYGAARLVPPIGTAPASPKTASTPQSSTTSNSGSQTYSFTAKNGTVYKVKATSQSAARTKAASFAEEDGTSLK